MTTIKGNLVDVHQRRIYPARLNIQHGKIAEIEQIAEKIDGSFILPGFIDSHIHIESSMLVPEAFGAVAVAHGTVGTISDPHEIANVCGIAGVEFMLRSAAKSPLKFNFGAPSCVPATAFETAGATLGVDEVDQLLQREEIKYLAEMMNFPGVLFKDKVVMGKIAAAQKYNKPIDGHAPGLRGAEAATYAAAGISTDHECVSAEEAEDKLAAGMYILIREGSAARNFDALVGLFGKYPGKLMFCSDDKHPDELVKGHINILVKKALATGADFFDVLHAACVLPVQHYGLDIGQLRKDDAADFIMVNNLDDFDIQATYINGELVAKDGQSLITFEQTELINNFDTALKSPTDFNILTTASDSVRCKVIVALNGQIITEAAACSLPVQQNKIEADVRQDVIKIAVVNRYNNQPPSVAFVKNFGLKKGGLASSVAHDSHNIVAVGVDDESLCAAVNAVIEANGGISYYNGVETQVMPLPVAGLMSDRDAYTVARQYELIDQAVKQDGCILDAPFMTLSFLALPVIPQLKITDKGLFDVNKFDFVGLEAEE
jgi:adenine deaminase